MLDRRDREWRLATDLSIHPCLFAPDAPSRLRDHWPCPDFPSSICSKPGIEKSTSRLQLADQSSRGRLQLYILFCRERGAVEFHGSRVYC